MHIYTSTPQRRVGLNQTNNDNVNELISSTDDQFEICNEFKEIFLLNDSLNIEFQAVFVYKTHSRVSFACITLFSKILVLILFIATPKHISGGPDLIESRQA